MKRILFSILLFCSVLGFSQETVYYRNGTSRSNWNDNENPWYRSCDTYWLPVPNRSTCNNFGAAGRTYVNFDHNSQVNMNVNGGYFDIKSITFKSGASAGRTFNNVDGGGINVDSGISVEDAAVITHTFNVPVALGASCTFNSFNSTLSFSSNFYLNNFLVTFSGNNFISGPISQNGGNGSVTKNGSGTLTLANSGNSYTGVTKVDGGTLSIGSIANGGANSPIGASSNAASNLVLGGGILRYTGNTASTDRAFTLTAGTTSTIDVATAGQNLTISGSSASTTGALTKIGNGTLTLTGNNSYSGGTTVSAGSLVVQKNGHSAAITSGSIEFTFASTTQAAGMYNFLPGQLTGASRTLTSNLVSSKSVSFDPVLGSVTICDLSSAPTSVTGTATICSGGSTSLTVFGGSKGTGATTQWYTGSCGGTLAGTGDVFNTGILTSNATYYVRYSGDCNVTTCASVAVTVNPPVAITPFSPATATRCQGAGTVTTTTTATNNTGNIVYSIDSTGSGNSIDASTGAVTYASGYTGTTIITATAQGCGGPVTTALTVTVNPLQTPTVGLTSSDLDNVFAYGTGVTFTAAASGVSGNTGIVYDFKVNGVSRQSGSSNSFTTTTISDQQQVSVSISVTGGTCMQATTASSNIITNTVSGAVLVYISNFCGQTLPFLTAPIYSTTAVVTGNPTVQYQFRVKRVGGASETLALRSTPGFNLTQSTLYAYNTSYEVYVSAVVNGVVQPESSACTITTPAAVPPATVQSTYCGSTLADAYSPIFAATVPGATGYRFDVFQGSTHITTVERSVNYFYLTNLPSWTYNTSYTVYVAVKINNEAFGSFGTVPCTVTTPQLATPGLVACGSQMATVSSPIFTTTVSGATNYAFEISGPGINTTINRSLPYFYITSITGWNYGTTYTVKVTVTKGSEVGPQSTGCLLTTPSIPSTSVKAVQCDQILASAASPIYADAVYGATGYRFHVSDGTNETTVERSVNYFSINTVSFWQYNKVYFLTVEAVRNTSVSPVLTTCSVTTPAGPFTTIPDAVCNNPELTMSGSLSVNAYPGASSYLFVVEQYNDQSQLVGRYTKVSYTNSVALSTISGLPVATSLPGITYAWGVQVAVMGKYGEETKGCSFTLIPTPSVRMAQVPFSATAYPNPFASNFMVDVKTNSQSVVNVKVYDMVGRLVEQRDVKASDMESTNIGNSYPSGVYNVVITQDDNLETVRVIKR